ncbi:histidine phosphatase family protein [Shimia sp.]|uniref:SixA phosphatase family protein n=1 Tax=Shimia sp. TaxID=1954381 RepID=UPI0035669701
MPLELILMRHAKSSWDDPLLTDFDRVLNARGRASAVAMGKWLRETGHLPEQTLCSSSARTRETRELAAMGGAVIFSDALYHASAARMLSALKEVSAATVLMIGHNPGIAMLAEALAIAPPDHPRFRDYPTCATTVFAFDAADWGAVGPASGRVVAFKTPRELLE